MSDLSLKKYRKGGLVMLPFITIGLIIAFFFKAPINALLSISIFGFGTSLCLIYIGRNKKTQV